MRTMAERLREITQRYIKFGADPGHMGCGIIGEIVELFKECAPEERPLTEFAYSFNLGVNACRNQMLKNLEEMMG